MFRNWLVHSPRLLTDYHQVSSHRRLVVRAIVGKGPSPVCGERDGGVLALRQDNITYIRVGGNNSLLSRVSIKGRIECVRHVHCECMALRSVFDVDVVDDHMVSFIDSDRIWHECVMGYVVESALTEWQVPIEEIECPRSRGGIVYDVSDT